MRLGCPASYHRPCDAMARHTCQRSAIERPNVTSVASAPSQVAGQSPDACCGAHAGICAGHGCAHGPTGPACPARRSPAPFLPLRMHAIAAGDQAAGAAAAVGGGESVNAKLTCAANPLILNAPHHVLQRAALPVPGPDPPGPGLPPMPESRHNGQWPPPNTPHQSHPMTFRRLPRARLPGLAVPPDPG
jgi:hypothetical protein